MYSQDLRKKVVEALDNGRSIRGVASDFGVSPTTVQSWKKDITPKTSNNRRPPKISLEALIKDVELYPDDYLRERAIRFNCSANGIRKALIRLGISKKNRPAS